MNQPTNTPEGLRKKLGDTIGDNYESYPAAYMNYGGCIDQIIDAVITALPQKYQIADNKMSSRNMKNEAYNEAIDEVVEILTNLKGEKQ